MVLCWIILSRIVHNVVTRWELLIIYKIKEISLLKWICRIMSIHEVEDIYNNSNLFLKCNIMDRLINSLSFHLFLMVNIVHIFNIHGFMIIHYQLVSILVRFIFILLLIVLLNHLLMDHFILVLNMYLDFILLKIFWYWLMLMKIPSLEQELVV